MNICDRNAIMRNTVARQTAKMRNGFTLIEVMIALAVLTIGLTGLAAMQLSAMQFSHSSHYRSMASTIALDIEESLWLKLAGNDLDCADGWDGVPGWDDEVAEFDGYWDRTNLEDGDGPLTLRIPNLDIAAGVAEVAAPVVRIPIIMSWTEKRFEDTDQTDLESFTFNIQIQCT